MEEAEKKLSLGFLLIHGNEHMKSYVCVCVTIAILYFMFRAMLLDILCLILFAREIKYDLQ